MMAQPLDPKALQALESEAKECEKADDHLGEIDIYEEIIRRGWAKAYHLVALGHGYFKCRQRQDAKTVWLRALEMDPTCVPARQVLDEYFPGWEKKAETDTGSQTGEHEPPPPPSFAKGGPARTLSVDTIVKQPKASILPPELAPKPTGIQQPARPATTVAPAPARPIGRPPQVVVVAGTVEAQPPHRSVFTASVNWEYILADAAEEATTRHS